MGDRSGIEWTDATWNPVRGCTRVSEGCRNCYAEVMAARFSQPGRWGHGFAGRKNGEPRWTGKVALIKSQLLLPLRWTKPRRIFVNSTSDLFHESLPDADIDRVFAVMALCPQHIFQVLTKRPERMRGYLSSSRAHPVGLEALHQTLRYVSANPHSMVGTGIILQGDIAHLKVWPLPNVWLGTSVENQETADARIPHLLDTPAALRFLSCEPLLGPLDIYNGDPDPRLGGHRATKSYLGSWWEPGDPPKAPPRQGIEWVICGGESGPNARPMHPDWARSLRDQCAAANDVPFFFKQWGEWAPDDDPDGKCATTHLLIDGDEIAEHDCAANAGNRLTRLGKSRAGRLLDDVAHNSFPKRGE